MPRLSNNRSPILDELFRAILSLENMDECRTFFSDLFTMQEMITFSQRLQVARLLHEGNTYEMVRKQVPVSNATITRINTELQYGSGGYKKVIERMNETNEST